MYLAKTAPFPVCLQTMVGIRPANLNLATFSRTWSEIEAGTSISGGYEAHILKSLFTREILQTDWKSNLSLATSARNQLLT